MSGIGDLEGEGYLDAFMNGFEFVLLAMRGRLAEEPLPEAERARIEAFLADYGRISRAYQERRSPSAEKAPRIVRALRAEGVPMPMN